MNMTTRARAHHYLSLARRAGWRSYHLVTDYATEALMLDGYSERDAMAAVAAAWADSA